MKLRYKLFLTVGSLFIIAFVASFFLETNMTRTKLVHAKKGLRKSILDLNEQKRQHIEKFLTISIAEELAQITALLQNIAEYRQLISSYAPTKNAEEIGTWIGSSTTLVANKWIDFIQDTDEGTLSSLILPDPIAMKGACHAHIDTDLTWVTLEGEEPLIGVRFYIDPKRESTPVLTFLPGTNPSVFILFSPESIPLYLQEWTGAHPPFMQDFFSALGRAAVYIKDIPPHGEERKQWIIKAIASLPPFETNLDPIRCIPATDKNLKQELEDLLLKNDEIFMIWRLASLLSKGPFSPGAPKGIARFPDKGVLGEGFLAAHIFASQPLFNDQAYFQANPPTISCWHPANSIAIINPATQKNVFFGNTIKTAFDARTGFLTIARNADHVLLELALSLHQTAFLVHDGKVISAFARDGDKIDPSPHLPLDEMLQKKNGILDWKGQRYFFLHMIPFPSLDLHFFIIQLESQEFAFVNEMDTAAKKLIASLSIEMRIAALVSLALVLLILNLLSKQIARPVTQLARAAQSVGTGHLEDVEIPTPSDSPKDEIGILCTAFSEMVKGLKEKEKVKAVLNKVVSQEIAQEILHGNVHLGGEEKVVTVLFADIRDFTNITSKMDPKNVVEMLNRCMTKISNLIDENGGVIDKYVGDEVMALFGAPIEKPESALQAVESAIQMMNVLKTWNVERAVRNLPPIEMGVGIHTGVVLAGNMGAENRLNYTVLGSNVNLASRLCDAAGRGEVLISQATYEALGVKESIEVEPLPPTIFKGFEEPIVVLRVKGWKK